MSKIFIVQGILLLLSFTFGEEQCYLPPYDIDTCDIKPHSCINGKLVSNGKSCPVGTRCCRWGCGSYCFS